MQLVGAVPFGHRRSAKEPLHVTVAQFAQVVARHGAPRLPERRSPKVHGQRVPAVQVQRICNPTPASLPGAPDVMAKCTTTMNFLRAVQERVKGVEIGEHEDGTVPSDWENGRERRLRGDSGNVSRALAVRGATARGQVREIVFVPAGAWDAHSWTHWSPRRLQCADPKAMRLQ